MKNALVSIIIPNFNKGAYIARTIDSVLAQTYTKIEVIVIDDGSTDDSNAILQSFGDQIKCLNQQNSGVCSARNRGINTAVGDYVAFLDSDDIWEPTKLEKQVRLLEDHPDIGLCFTGAKRVDSNLQPLGNIDANSHPDFCQALLLHSNVVTGSCSSVMMRSSIAKESGGFDTDLTNYEDWEFWLRLSLVTKFAPISDYLVSYRSVQGTASFNPPAILERNVIGALNKFFAAPHLPEKYKALRDQSYSNNWLILSGEYLHAKQYAGSLRCLWNGLCLYPQNITRPLGLPLRWTRRALTG